MTFATLLAGCSGSEGEMPNALMDGRPAKAPPVELEGHSRPVVLTAVNVVPVEKTHQESPSATCRRAFAGATPRGPVVERVGVVSASVTFATESGLHGCDDSRGPRDDGRRWCGTSFGVLTGGRLADPRLDLAGCKTATGRPVGFAWIQAGPKARYVTVGQDDYVEAYEHAGSLPVRIATTSDVEVEGSRATFSIAEHDAAGRRLRHYDLVATVAG